MPTKRREISLLSIVVVIVACNDNNKTTGSWVGVEFIYF